MRKLILSLGLMACLVGALSTVTYAKKNFFQGFKVEDKELLDIFDEPDEPKDNEYGYTFGEPDDNACGYTFEAPNHNETEYTFGAPDHDEFFNQSNDRNKYNNFFNFDNTRQEKKHKKAQQFFNEIIEKIVLPFIQDTRIIRRQDKTIKFHPEFRPFLLRNFGIIKKCIEENRNKINIVNKKKVGTIIHEKFLYYLHLQQKRKQERQQQLGEEFAQFEAFVFMCDPGLYFCIKCYLWQP